MKKTYRCVTIIYKNPKPTATPPPPPLQHTKKTPTKPKKPQTQTEKKHSQVNGIELTKSFIQS